ncbi:PREDICTED: zinc finger MYM-type protein 1-like [Fragaria vesca subsp. vesca]
MERFFKRKSDMLQPPANCEISKDIRVEAEINLSELPSDPGLRKKISDYPLSIQDQVRRVYLQRGPCLTFRGHDESENSSNQGNFVELLQFLADHDEQLRAVALKNAPANLKLTSPTIQKEIVNAATVETTDAIIRDMDNVLFSILVDEARDVSIKEQMAVIFCYVDKRGCVIERFIGIVHVANTTAKTLKKAIDELLSKHKLSISSLRGQGFDGASNMSGELNGLKTLILKDNPTAFYVHCFAHQLQLALVAVAKKHSIIGAFFTSVANVVNIVGASSKRRDILREKVDVLDEIANDKVGSDQKDNAYISLGLLQSFDYIFSLHLMRIVLGISHELSQALQKDDQDIINAMDLVKICKRKLQNLRDNGWDSLLDQVVIFCGKENIMVPNMSEQHICKGKSKRKSPEITNLHYYHFDFFCAVIDLQLQELNNRFNEDNTELLLCIACLSPNYSFSAFNEERLMLLASFYPTDFSTTELLLLESQLDIYIDDMQSNTKFQDLHGISDLAQKLVETGKSRTYMFVYKLITLALVLPVATATFERAFSAMNIVKNRTRDRIGDQWLNDSLIVYLEKDIFNDIDNEAIIQRFQNMATHRGHL